MQDADTGTMSHFSQVEGFVSAQYVGPAHVRLMQSLVMILAP